MATKKVAETDIPSMDFRLSYATATSLQHLILAQMVHARNVADETGQTALLDSATNLQPFLNGLTRYLEKYSR